jgi:hypothetical protein
LSKINFQTAYLDLSIMYGADEDAVKRIRSFKKGELLIGEQQTRTEEIFPPVIKDKNVCPAGGVDTDSCMLTGKKDVAYSIGKNCNLQYVHLCTCFVYYQFQAILE